MDMTINQILDKIDENQLFVPAFQREFVWKRNDVKKLVDSLIHEFPTGTMLTWETNEPPELKGSWEYDTRQGAIRIILDGQQRITALYMLIRDKLPPYYTEADIGQDPRGLYINIANNDLEYYSREKMQNNPYWINITAILQRKIRERNVIKAIEDRGKELTLDDGDIISNNLRAVEKILERKFVEQEVPVKTPLKTAIDIFYIVNKSGVNLTEAELALAQISGYWPKARESFKRKLGKLKKDDFVFGLDFIVYCLLGILHHKGSELERLHSSDNKDNLYHAWEQLDSKLLDYVVSILHSRAFVDHTKEINSVYAIVPIIVYVYKKYEEGTVLSEVEIRKIIKWFYYSQVRMRYTGQFQKALDKDLSIIAGFFEKLPENRIGNPFDELLAVIAFQRTLKISIDEFIGASTKNPLYSLMRWYFKSRNAVCFTTGIGIRKNMGREYTLEKDHIFPYSILKTRGYDVNSRHKYSLAQEITNRAILTKVANRSKGNKSAKDYLSSVKQTFPNALQLQSIPADENLWEIDNFEEFLSARRKLLAEQLNNFLENIIETREIIDEISIDEMISGGESSELEFKSSLRWSVRGGVVDKKLENVILKSIAAFGNRNGGMLVIGVNDEGEAIGLDNDFRSLDGGKDAFERHLRNLINGSFGKVFATSGLKITFPMMDGFEICRIEVQPNAKPLYLEIADSGGQKTEKFYVRNGNSSQELSLSEMNQYVQSHWNNK